MRARELGWLYVGLTPAVYVLGAALDIDLFMLFAGVLLGTGAMMIAGPRR